MSSRVEEISVDQIERNPMNPRIFFESSKMELLKNSIAEVGVLVPITVYRDVNKRKFILIDGERRWRCCIELERPTIPAIIIPEPDPETNLLSMFSIHHLREKWSLIATALKLEQLMNMMKIEDSKELATLTGMPTRTVNRCKILLSYHRKYLDLLLTTDKNEIKPDFFMELYPILQSIPNTVPNLLKKYEKEYVIDKLLEKYRNKKIYPAREFRKINILLEEVSNKKISQKIAETFFNKLITDYDSTIDNLMMQLEIEYLTGIDQTIQICNSLTKLLSQITEEDIKENKKFINSLKQLNKEIDRLITYFSNIRS